mgnify:CR=1 FL=1
MSEKQDFLEEQQQLLEQDGFRIQSSDFSRPWGGFFVLDESQADQFIESYFPTYKKEELMLGNKLSPKVLVVEPGKRLSWQYHHRRAEIWRVVEGEVGVVMSENDEETEVNLFEAGDIIVLKNGQRHRLVGLKDWGVIAEIWQHTDPANPSDEDDIVRLQDGYEIQDAIHSAYDTNGLEETVFIVRSNKRANQYNQQIRTSILSKESELSTGDYLMVVKNNYFWLKDIADSEAGFIANGDIIEILEIRKIQELYGFKFATVKVRMVDYPNQKPFDTILLLDTITSESPSLTYEESNKLYQEVLLDYEEETSKYRKLQKVKENPHFNALQVKFSYAITCHKSQGGQWKTVFIEQPYLPNGIDVDYIRWLYTALTRAQEKVYLIGFKDEFFK